MPATQRRHGSVKTTKQDEEALKGVVIMTLDCVEYGLGVNQSPKFILWIIYQLPAN